MLDLLEVEPDFDLGRMSRDQALPALTGRLLRALDAVLAKVRQAWVLARGDTTTVLTASLPCFYRRVRFDHIEAGLRTGTRDALPRQRGESSHRRHVR